MSFEPPAPDGHPPEPTPAERRPVARGAVLALVFAGVVLVAGGLVAWLGLASAADADRGHAAARRGVAAARGALRRTESDLAAARAAVATFAASARGATAASVHVIELEAALVDRLGRLRDAGTTRDTSTYNQIVGEVNGASGELVAVFRALQDPLTEFSSALDDLPTARCTAPAGETVTWTDYGADGLDCARIRVPLDYGDPRGEQIELTVVRRRADDPATSLGPLVLNPGGPGTSGISFMRDAILRLPPELLHRFDLIAFDPRGVGRSTPVDCADRLDALFDPDLTAATPRAR